MSERLSVVITCFREGRLLTEAVRSAREQTSAADEILVVNDASTDEATNVACRELEAGGPVRILWLDRNLGPSGARNEGFAAAEGDLLVPLDADDLLPPNALADVRAGFAQHPDAGFIHGSFVRQDAPGQDRLVAARALDLHTLLRPRRFSLSTNWTLIGTAPLRKRLWTAVGASDPSMGANDLHDVDFWIRALDLPCRHYPIPAVIYVWRKYLGRNSRQVTPQAWQRIARKHFDVYRRVGLEYRAYELLLVAAKCSDADHDWTDHRRSLLRLMAGGELHLSSLAALCPAPLLRVAIRIAGARR